MGNLSESVVGRSETEAAVETIEVGGLAIAGSWLDSDLAQSVQREVVRSSVLVHRAEWNEMSINVHCHNRWLYKVVEFHSCSGNAFGSVGEIGGLMRCVE